MKPDVSGDRLVVWSNPFGVVHVGKNGWTAVVVGKGVIDEVTSALHYLTQSEWRRVQAHKRALPVRRKKAS